MPFSTQNCRAAAQSFFQHLGVPQARQSTVMWLVFIAMSCVVTACNTASVPNSTASPQVVATRWTALLIGKLVKVDGCLRVIADTPSGPGTSYLLIWPPEQHIVTIEKDTVRIVDLWGGGKKEVVWHIGQTVRLGGGEILTPSEQWSERMRRDLDVPANCPGPYWVVGDVDD